MGGLSLGHVGNASSILIGMGGERPRRATVACERFEVPNEWNDRRRNAYALVDASLAAAPPVLARRSAGRAPRRARIGVGTGVDSGAAERVRPGLAAAVRGLL